MAKRISALIVFGIICYWVGLQVGNYQPDKPFLTSVYQTRSDTLVEDLCIRDGIEYDSGSFVFCCPKCLVGGARIQHEPGGSIYYGFHTTYPELEKLKPGETVSIGVSHSQTYCGKCRYPIGTDWNIKELKG